MIPRIVIAGTNSGVGKTTIATGLMAALARRGYRVQPYKVGPDYIDPSYHTFATGLPCRNLDTWMVGEATVQATFRKTSQGADIAVIEGVMGLYDGASGIEETGSTAQVAKLLQAPVILVVDAKSMARSAAAVVLGFQSLDPELKLAGVILNRIGSDRHYQLVKEAIEHYTGVPIVGAIRKNAGLSLPERHLGLVPMAERGNLEEDFTRLASLVEEGINLKKIVELAREGEGAAGSLPGRGRGQRRGRRQQDREQLFAPLAEKGPSVNPKDAEHLRVPIAYAWDEAFSFYYQDTLDLLTEVGARLIPFSPLHDPEIPAGVGGLYLGGGFPELFLPKLSANGTMLSSIREAGRQGLPVYAECGGLMYLCREIIDFEGQAYPVAGLVPAACRMEKRLVAMGYIEAEALADNLLCQKGEIIRGHEFHYSDLVELDESFTWAFRCRKKTTGVVTPGGFCQNNLLASYLHVNLAGKPPLARRFVERCREFLQIRTPRR